MPRLSRPRQPLGRTSLRFMGELRHIAWSHQAQNAGLAKRSSGLKGALRHTCAPAWMCLAASPAGSYAETICPGFGSKKRRKAESTAFTLRCRSVTVTYRQRLTRRTGAQSPVLYIEKSAMSYTALTLLLGCLSCVTFSKLLCGSVRCSLRSSDDPGQS